MNAHGPPLDELGKGVDEESLMVRLCAKRHQGLAAGEDERSISCSYRVKG